MIARGTEIESTDALCKMQTCKHDAMKQIEIMETKFRAQKKWKKKPNENSIINIWKKILSQDCKKKIGPPPISYVECIVDAT